MRVLITGASGILGSTLSLTASDVGHEVIPVSHRQPIRIDSIEGSLVDLTDQDACMELMLSQQPEWVVHCAAATNVDQCETDPDWAFALNRDAAKWVAAAAKEIGAALIHISTDAVFAGESGPHSEIDVVQPINVYGKSKLEGEMAVQDAYPEAAIVRTNFYGWSPPGRSSLAEWFIDNLRHGRPHMGFTDILISPLLTNHLVEVILQLLESGLSGVFHVGSVDSLSKYEMGIKLANVFELDTSLIEPSLSTQGGLKASRPKDLSLSVSKIVKALGISMPNTDDGIDGLRTLEQDGFRERISAVTLNGKDRIAMN